MYLTNVIKHNYLLSFPFFLHVCVCVCVFMSRVSLLPPTGMLRYFNIEHWHKTFRKETQGLKKSPSYICFCLFIIASLISTCF